ncbi:uncharacterized protein LOC129765116 isoform X2 [Toxorhynchites rutilus septentrionalis]|nr:uncharacterized protein LOC129765116 isoform X2 [Toxorhynchites rutilus septentrionalis]
MLWRILTLLTAHVHILGLGLGTVDAQDSNIIGTHDRRTSLSLPSATAWPGKSDDSTEKRVVVNWKLTCEQLCGEGYGGPACGLACLAMETKDDFKRIKLDTKAHAEVCSKLCENGLGSKHCDCEPSSSAKRSHDHHGVCKSFCVSANVQLNGCGQCANELPEGDAASGIRPTTPNWDELCTLWCKIGEGGTLCNCDLPPFV